LLFNASNQIPRHRVTIRVDDLDKGVAKPIWKSSSAMALGIEAAGKSSALLFRLKCLSEQGGVGPLRP
jgi:hypothetical protein